MSLIQQDQNHITGNFVVDTTTLVVDATNNRVGINTSNPSVALDVVGASNISGALNIDSTLAIDDMITIQGTTNASIELNCAVSTGIAFIDLGATSDYSSRVSHTEATGDFMIHNKVADITLDCPGNVYVGTSSTTACIFPSLTTTERDALTGIAGMVIYNETTSKLNVYTSTWEVISST